MIERHLVETLGTKMIERYLKRATICFFLLFRKNDIKHIDICLPNY